MSAAAGTCSLIGAAQSFAPASFAPASAVVSVSELDSELYVGEPEDSDLPLSLSPSRTREAGLRGSTVTEVGRRSSRR